MEVGCVGGLDQFVLTILCTALVYDHKLTQLRNCSGHFQRAADEMDTIGAQLSLATMRLVLARDIAILGA